MVRAKMATAIVDHIALNLKTVERDIAECVRRCFRLCAANEWSRNKTADKTEKRVAAVRGDTITNKKNIAELQEFFINKSSFNDLNFVG